MSIKKSGDSFHRFFLYGFCYLRILSDKKRLELDLISRLEIKNFLAFKHLKVEDLKKVNLITGRNNTGKTAFLEAIRAYKSSFDSAVIYDILYNRGIRLEEHENLYSLYNSVNEFESDLILSINNLTLKTLAHVNTSVDVYKIDEFISKLGFGYNRKYPDKKLDYLSFGFDENRLEEQWSKIALTPTEDDVFSVIKNSIQENFLKLNITSNGVLIRLEGEDKPVNIRRLGDGMKRIVSIAMALASSKNKILLIDEIETGLHHTVLSQLWEIIFRYSEKWNIQIFATTHSSDAIRTFRNVASETETTKGMVNILRLQKNRKDGEIEAVAYHYNEVDTILDANMELR